MFSLTWILHYFKFDHCGFICISPSHSNFHIFKVSSIVSHFHFLLIRCGVDSCKGSSSTHWYRQKILAILHLQMCWGTWVNTCPWQLYSNPGCISPHLLLSSLDLLSIDSTSHSLRLYKASHDSVWSQTTWHEITQYCQPLS